MNLCAGKVNNITIDKCSKMGVVFKVSINMYRAMHRFPIMLSPSRLFLSCKCSKQDVVAACEIVNCNGVEVQCQVLMLFG